MKRLLSCIAAAAVLMTSVAGTTLADTTSQNPFSQSQQRIEQNQSTPPAMPGQQNQDEQNQATPPAMPGQQNQDEQNQATPPAMPGQQNQDEQNQMTPPAMPGQQNQDEQNQATPPAMPGQQNQDEQNQAAPPAMPGQQNQDEQNQEGRNPTMIVHTGNSGKLNMREAPGTDAKVTGRYRNGTQVEILEVGDEWVKVSINGKTGYMMIKFLEGELPSDGQTLPAMPGDGQMPSDGQTPPTMPGMPGGMPGNESVNYTAAATVTESSSGTAYSSTADGENAVLVQGNDVSLNGATVTKTGSASGENADFTGVNAAVLATGGATLTIDDASVTTDGTHANGVFSYGSGTTVNVSNTTITTSGNNSGGLMTTGGATLNASNLTVSTSGNSSAAIRSDRGGGTVTVNNGSYDTTGVGSPAIYSTADITVSDATLSASNSEAVVIEGGNSVTLENVDITGSNAKLNGQSTQKTNVLIYQSMSGDASEGSSTFTMTGGTMTAETGSMFHVTNVTTTITLEDVDFTYASDSNVFLDASADSWGSSGKNGGSVTLNLVDQDITGAILSDSVSSVTVNLDSASTWTLTGDSYVSAFNGDLSNVNLNGYTLYVNGVAVN